MTGTIPKLTVELVPSSMWGANLRTILNKKTWDCIRHNIYAAAGRKCEICTETGANGRVECHEKWEFDDLHTVQKLVGLLCLCPTCHQAKHIGRAVTTSSDSATAFMRVLRKLCEVNGWTKDQAVTHIEEEFARFNERSCQRWTLDITWLESHKDLLG